MVRNKSKKQVFGERSRRAPELAGILGNKLISQTFVPATITKLNGMVEFSSRTSAITSAFL